MVPLLRAGRALRPPARPPASGAAAGAGCPARPPPALLRAQRPALLRAQPPALLLRAQPLAAAAAQPRRHLADAPSPREQEQKEPVEDAVAVQNMLTVQEKSQYQKQWDSFKNAAFQSKIYSHFQDAGERVDDFIEDSDNIFVRGIRRVKHAITHVSEEAETLGEIKRLQPDFDLHTMSKLLEEEVVPGWVQAFLRGDAEGVEFMSKWSTQRAVEVSPAHPSQHGRLIDGLVCVCVSPDVRSVLQAAGAGGSRLPGG